jgi:eukaryotic-like serine/threonine-protein kinase
VQGVLGRGGVGVVYKAWHQRLNRDVALKMLLAGPFARPEEVERFWREAEAVASLRHPNIVQVYDLGDLDGRPYFTMEFVDGGNLAQKSAGTPQPAAQAAALVATLARAIQIAHQSGIIHRDLKPANILLTADGIPKVTDFGLARCQKSGAALTLTGVPVGTPSYMAPEQGQGRRDLIGPATDVYALGAILYELLTGRPPFRAETAAATLQQVLTEDAVPPVRLNPRVPGDLETICLKCLHKEPRRRYSSAAALAEDLDRFLRGEAIAARPESPFERLARGIRRRPAFAIATLSVLALMGGGLWRISERAAADRVAKANRESTDRAARDDLRDLARFLKSSSWAEARAALEWAKSRLGDNGSPELRRLVERGARDLALGAHVEKIRLDHLAVVLIAPGQADEQYAEAFREAGLGQASDEPEQVAARIRDSDIRNALLGALDHWSTHVSGRRNAWVLAVARKADTEPDPSGWRERARDPSVRADRTALLQVIRNAQVSGQSVPLLLALAASLRSDDPERLSFVKRIQQSHKADFWANSTLGWEMTPENPGEASRYLQAAVSIRPDLARSYEMLGWSLLFADAKEFAVSALEKAIELDPTPVRAQHLLAAILNHAGRHEEAARRLQAALVVNPDEPTLRRALETTLKLKGRCADPLAPRDRRAPDLFQTYHMLLGPGDDARRAWRAAIGAVPPRYEGWCAYTEFCSFVGNEEEYRRARRALLAEFGASADPCVGAWTARACLLLPASGDDLRQAVALADRSAAADRWKYRSFYPHFQFARGLAEYRQGRFDQAIAAMSAADVLSPTSGLVVAMALHRSGRVAEGRKALKAAIGSHDGSAEDVPDPNNWVFHVLRREAEGMMLPK